MSTSPTPPDRSNLLMVKGAPFNAETPLDGLRDLLTPTPLHYVRSNFALPPHDGTIAIGGAVEQPITLSRAELRALGEETITVTLECAGNGRVGLMPLPTGEPWTGQAVATATWTGVPLRAVLERVKANADATDVAFSGADHGEYKGGPDIHFVRGLSLERALDPSARVLIAWGMNGEALNADHGAPFRLVAPGWYGMGSVKWLSQIELLTAPYEGQFQTKSYVFEWPERPWEPVRAMRPRALITVPDESQPLAPGTVTIRGKTWSGSGPITGVEVSIDGAGAWQPARVAPAIAEDVWQDWSFEWTIGAGEQGRHVVRARATDATGATQPDQPEWNRLGYGNNAVQVLIVNVK